uniref:Uncharacterized protein n=1 Tax=Octopus bimaculoides TaxID=37653 RepID=A0A0L8GI20_OCTBM
MSFDMALCLYFMELHDCHLDFITIIPDSELPEWCMLLCSYLWSICTLSVPLVLLVLRIPDFLLISDDLTLFVISSGSNISFE